MELSNIEIEVLLDRKNVLQEINVEGRCYGDPMRASLKITKQNDATISESDMDDLRDKVRDYDY